LDQGPKPAVLAVSSNLMALCFAVAFSGPELRPAALSSTDCVLAAPEQVAFCANFSRLSKFEGCVNLSLQLSSFAQGRFRRRMSKPLAQTPLLPHSTAFQCQNIQTPTRGARHLAPNYLYCSNLGLESSGPSGLRPGSNAWTALRLTPRPADPPFPAGPPNPVKVRSSLTCLCYSNRSYLQDQPCCRSRQASIACRLLRLG